jgi:coenzyme F420-reducing hydrogenase beta subunit
VVVCPNSAIAMQRDAEGFDYPVVDPSRCVDCGHCIAVCPMVEAPGDDGYRVAPKAYACWHQDAAIRAASSSGGVFTALAEQVLSERGTVFGAAFCDGLAAVRHVPARTPEDLGPLRGSKYVQSSTVEALDQVRGELANGRRVLFSGTPCQVAGLRKLVGTANGRLVTCDLVCHGVPSPGVFADYVAEQCREHGSEMTALDFRDKAQGWNFPRVRQRFADGRVVERRPWEDAFTHGFYRGAFLRPACYVCPFAQLPRVADVTLADFWGVGMRYPAYDDNKGTSLILANTERGEALLQACAGRVFRAECTLESATVRNRHISRPVAEPPCRSAFFDAYRRGSFAAAARTYMKRAVVLRRAAARQVKKLLWRMPTWVRSWSARLWFR